MGKSGTRTKNRRRMEKIPLDCPNQSVIRWPMIRLFTFRGASRRLNRRPYRQSPISSRPPIRLRQLILTLLMLMAISGLAYQAVRGERGLIGWQKLEQNRAHRQHLLTLLQSRNDALAARASRLRTDSLDIDFLDERARIVLGLVARDEMTVFLNSKSRPNN